jgi:hypothetical protein
MIVGTWAKTFRKIVRIVTHSIRMFELGYEEAIFVQCLAADNSQNNSQNSQILKKVLQRISQ